MKQFAAFDIDGTLIRWQLYHAVVDKLASANLLGDGAKEELATERLRWKKREDPESFRNYEQFVIKHYEAALPHLNPADFDAMVATVIEEYKDQAYTYTRNLIGSLKEQGYILLAISGSHHELVQAIALYYGFDDCIGSVYERTDGSFSGKVALATTDKAAALQNFVQKHNLSMRGSIAVGDSLSDASMLSLVEKPIAFNPDSALYQKARVEHWNIVVERKNVIYKLEDDHGSYVLA